MKKVNFLLWVVVGALLTMGACKGSKSATNTSDKPATHVATTPGAVDQAPAPTPQAEPVELIPFDPETRTGKLANGLTYYVKKNGKPENYAELRIALNAGSILESDAQQGLAHFAEHMCFNGTTNFPKSELVDYLESIGTRFGAHLNAYTSFDETVYMLRIPTNNEEQFEKGFQVLEDWAHQVSFDGEEIEKERGVVISEWRTRLGAFDRMNQQTFPKLYYNSRYAERLPIGKVEILENFKHEELKKYYQDWYRPDLMAVVAVGDFDLDEVEAKIKQKFGSIPKASNPREREYYPVPDHEETLIAIATDEEAPFNQVQIQYKHDPRPIKTLDDYRRRLVEGLATNMIRERLQELTQSENPPFTIAFSGYGRMARLKDSYDVFALVPDNKFADALEALLTENERALRYGFTASELERVKKARMTNLEKAFKEKDKTESRSLVMSYVYHYLSGTPVTGIENQLELSKKLLPGITIEEVNAIFKSFIREDNRVLTLMGSKKDGNQVPSEEDVRAILERVAKKEITPYEDDVLDVPLMAEMPQPGKVISETRNEEVDVTELELSNGIHVVLKPTDFKNDEIRMRSFSPGGTSLYSDDEFMSAIMASQIIGSSGVGPYDNIQLDKFLSDKVAGVYPYISQLFEGINGTCSPADMETFFQLVHLYFTQPRKDEKAFAATMARTRSFNANSLANPSNYFRSEVNKIMNNNHPRQIYIPTEEQLDEVKLDEAFRIYQDRFSDAGDFTFILVGNFEIDQMKAMLETYIASLPTNKREENWKDLGVESFRGTMEKVWRKGKEPKSQVMLKYTGDFEWNSKNRFHMSTAISVLRIMMRESMREDMGGVYGVRVSGGSSRDPKSEYEVTVSFTCDPDEADALINTAMKDIEDLQKNGPSEKNMVKVKETLRKELEEGLTLNRYWLNYLFGAMRYETDPSNILKQEGRIDALTAKEVQMAAQKYLDQQNFGKFILHPEVQVEER